MSNGLQIPCAITWLALKWTCGPLNDWLEMNMCHKKNHLVACVVAYATCYMIRMDEKYKHIVCTSYVQYVNATKCCMQLVLCN
jgi:hypothetical protein